MAVDPSTDLAPAPRLSPVPQHVSAQAAVREFSRPLRLLEYERMVRPFLDPLAAQRLLDRQLRRRRKIGETTEAAITWGGPSDFAVGDGSLPTVQLQTGGEQQQDPGLLGQVTRTYSEIGRQTETVRVENPDDPSQYVEVERIKRISFSAPDGSVVQFVLSH